MRIVHVTQPTSAGVGAVVAALAGHQAGRGHDVTVVCPTPETAGPLRAVLDHPGVDHVTWAAGRHPGPATLGETRQLARLLRDLRPDVVVLHSAKAGLAGRLTLRGRLPTVFVPHAWSFEAASGVVGRASLRWEQVAQRWCSAVVCVSAEERDRGRDAGVPSTRMTTIDNGVDVEHVHPVDRGEARVRRGLPDAPTVVCVGRLARQKGQDRLLRAWPRVRRTVPAARLVLVGDGPDRAALEQRQVDGAVLVGAQDDPRDWFAAADVVAVVSRWEAGALVPLEAMASARPVVAVDVTGVRQVLGGTGTVVRNGDDDLAVVELADALVTRLLDPEGSAETGRAARDRVVASWSLDRTLTAWDELLDEVVSTPDRPTRPTRSDARAPLRLLVPLDLARAVVGHPDVGPRVQVVPARGWRETRAAVRRREVDAAVLDSAAPGARRQAALLRAGGTPVWWLGTGGPCPGVGAPAVVSPDLSSDAVDRVAEAAARPGAGLDPDLALSVVITTLDEGEELDDVVDAVVGQLRPDDELVVVDGGSTDGSVERVTGRWAHEGRVVIHSSPGAGISAGRNTGVRLARHDVVVCTDAGCALEPGWLQGMRRAFAGADAPGLVSGPYRPVGTGPVSRAQAWACYPDPAEVGRADLWVRLHTRLFGTGFDPRFAIGRNVGFTRDAWSAAGGFPEHLPTGEDVSFGLAVARTHRCAGSADAVVSWRQRPDLRATWRMYRSYGRASTDGGDLRLLARDAARGAAYVVGVVLVASGARSRRVALVGAAGYLGLPLRRALRDHARPADLASLPLALATKDLGKLAGAVQGAARARARRQR